MLRDYTQLLNIQLSQRQNLPNCSAIYFAIAREQVLDIGLASYNFTIYPIAGFQFRKFQLSEQVVDQEIPPPTAILHPLL